MMIGNETTIATVRLIVLTMLAALASRGVLSDSFATTPVNQAHALATLLNERT